MNDNENQNNGDEGDNYDKYDSDGELNVDGERQKSGPWNKVSDDGTTAAADVTAVAAAAATTAAAALQERNSASSVYISPALRNGPVSIIHQWKLYLNIPETQCITNLWKHPLYSC